MTAPSAADLRRPPVGDPADAERLRTLLTAESRYALRGHLPRARTEPGGLVPLDEAPARVLSSVAVTLAVGSACRPYAGALDDDEVTAAAVEVVRGCVAGHVTQRPGGWGRTWQGPLVSGHLGTAALLLGDALPPADRRRVEQVVADEADVLEGVPVRYLRDAAGTLLTPGDTGGEEESWRARGVSAALALLPASPSAPRWHRSLVLRQAAAYALPSDVGRRDLLHRSPWCTWLAGSNLDPDGTLQNHGFAPNPNYMRPVHHVGAALLQRLAGRPVSPSAWANLDVLYAALTRLYDGAGGLRYPAGTDVRMRTVVLYANDVQHRVLGLGGAQALGWERRHGDLALGQVQPDGRVDQPGSEELYGGVHPDIGAKLAEAWLVAVLGPLSGYAVDDALLGAPPQPRPVGCPDDGPGFPDVAGAPAAAARWVAARGLLGGLPDGRFAPTDPVSRLTALLSLFRAAGSPGGAPPHPFSDVPHDGGEADLAARWAYAAGVAAGRGGGVLDPGASLTRGQAVSLVWRAQGRPAAPSSGFGDLTGDVRAAADWAAAAGVVQGRAPGVFAPTDLVTRGQWALVLHRLHAGG